MGRKGISRQPSPYPAFVFHGVRVVQFVSSIIVMGMLSFFCHSLIKENYYIPWTFLLLLTVSVLTLLSLFLTSFFYHNRTLKPRMSIFVNAFLSLLWILGFSLMYWNISGTLAHHCDIENWGNSTGIKVCMIYKALAAFIVFGLVSTFFSLGLDIYTDRRINHRGTYDIMGNVGARGATQLPDGNAKEACDDHSEGKDPNGAASDWDSNIEIPSQVTHDGQKPSDVNRPIEASKFGYSVPEEQTRYDGAGGQ